MPPHLPQPRRLLRAALAVASVALGLGGCMSRQETTGSIATGAVAQASLRETAEALGKRYDASPGEARVSVEYASVLRSLGQKAQAVAVLQQAAIRNPKELWVLAAYGKALADDGKLRDAQGVLERAHLPDRPDWRILNVQGAVADQLGEFDAAQRYYEAALRLAPGEPSVLSNQGLSYALAKRLPQAEAILRQAANDPRADGRVRQNLALVLGLEGRLADAEAVLRRDLPPAEAATAMTSIRRMVSQPNSWKALRQSAEKNPTRSDAPGSAT